jgi:ATP-dependent DNA helicase PIF1
LTFATTSKPSCASAVNAKLVWEFRSHVNVPAGPVGRQSSTPCIDHGWSKREQEERKTVKICERRGEKARADVERRRELRRKEAHERREGLHAEFCGVAYTPPKEEDKPSSLQIVLEIPGGLKTECFDADYPEGAPKFVQQDNIDGHRHKPEARTRRFADVVAWGENVFYTDGAGTGKSTVLRAIVRELREQCRRAQVVTPTEISSFSIGGSTYFTWAGWIPGVTKKSIVEIETMAISKERRQRIKDTDVLIIDEISMLESNQFRRLDRACRAARQRDRPFGGMQVVVTGDFYQLLPVKPFHTCFDCGVELKTRALCRWCQASAGEGEDIYQSSPAKDCRRRRARLRKQMDCPRCKGTFEDDDQWPFRSDTWAECDFQCVSLTEVHRQSDPTFVGILNALRVGDRLDRRQLSLLDGRRSDVGKAIELSPKRDGVELKNRKGFEAIKRPVRAYKCQDYVHIQAHHPHLESKKERDGHCNLVGCQDHRFPPLLETKLGMPVILLANINPGAGLVNGSQGRIVRYEQHEPLLEERQRRLQASGEFGQLEEHEMVSWTEQQMPDFPLPLVEFENGVECPMYPVCQDTELGDPAPFSVVVRTQTPLLPAWAITIHKSQGMTLEKVVVNLDDIFEPQMAYVALSRVRSPNGLKVVSDVGLEGLQERGRLGGGGLAVRTFME